MMNKTLSQTTIQWLCDRGHHLGAIEASAYLHDRDLEIIFDFDKLALNRDLGFENK